jgi:ligand-binding sensor domain-containing protein
MKRGLPYHVATLMVLALTFSSGVKSQSKFLQGYTLNSQANLPPSNSVSHIAVRDSTVWIGTGKGLARSTSGGQAWESYRLNSAFAKDGIFAVAVRGDTVWASTGFVKDVGDARVQTGAGYAYSVNNGAVWHGVGQTLDGLNDTLIQYGLDLLRILPVVVPEQNVTFDIALSPGRVWIASWASGLRYSVNNGQSWQRVILPAGERVSPRTTPDGDTVSYTIDPRRNNNFLAFSVLAVDADTIWCGTAGGVNKSTDGGVSWVRFTHNNQASPILGDWIIAIQEQRFQSIKRIWTTNWRAEQPVEENGVSYTDDGGRTWNNLLRGVKAYDFAFKDSIAYIATEQGLYRTDDGGLSFMRSGTVIDPATRQVLTTSAFFSVGVVGDTVWAGTGDGLVSTIDNATSPFASVWKIHRTYQSVAGTKTTYAYPNPFAPTLEGTRIHYAAPGSGSTVSVDVFDFGMNPVRTIVLNAPRGSGEFDEVWDGRDDTGKVVTNGVYFYRVRVGGQEPAWGKILVLR